METFCGAKNGSLFSGCVNFFILRAPSVHIVERTNDLFLWIICPNSIRGHASSDVVIAAVCKTIEQSLPLSPTHRQCTAAVCLQFLKVSNHVADATVEFVFGKAVYITLLGTIKKPNSTDVTLKRKAKEGKRRSRHAVLNEQNDCVVMLKSDVEATNCESRSQLVSERQTSDALSEPVGKGFSFRDSVGKLYGLNGWLRRWLP